MTRVRIAGAVLLVLLGAGLLTRVTERAAGEGHSIAPCHKMAAPMICSVIAFLEAMVCEKETAVASSTKTQNLFVMRSSFIGA